MLAAVRDARERIAGERGFVLLSALLILFVMALLTAA